MNFTFYAHSFVLGPIKWTNPKKSTFKEINYTTNFYSRDKYVLKMIHIGLGARFIESFPLIMIRCPKIQKPNQLAVNL